MSLAAALVTATIGLVLVATVRGAVGGVHPAAAPAVVAPPGSDAFIAGFSRFALNALLAPLLDDDEPPRWTDVALPLFCDPGTTVEVDGQPIVPGARLPARAFTLRWHIDRCWPLGDASIELSGVVELLVFHEDAGLGAVVIGDRLRVSSAKGSSRLGGPFAAWLSFAAVTAPP